MKILSDRMLFILAKNGISNPKDIPFKQVKAFLGFIEDEFITQLKASGDLQQRAEGLRLEAKRKKANKCPK